MRVLIVGSGGREYALVSRLIREGHTVLAAPGNPGMAAIGATCHPVMANNPDGLLALAQGQGVDITIVGPEAPLELGIVNLFRENGLVIVGPTKEAALLTEISKVECWKLLWENHVPVPYGRVYENYAGMVKDLVLWQYPYVIKYDGLAEGKGVAVVRNDEDKNDAIRFFEQFRPGRYLVQNCEEGPELSFFLVAHGEDFVHFESCWDVKPIYPGGPNTGGMGGGSPHPLMTPALREQIERSIARPILKALCDAGCPYTGPMYLQIMLTDNGPVVIEINARFGDPEAQQLMVRLESLLLPVLAASAVAGELKLLPQPVFTKDVAVAVVMAGDGYPGKVRKGDFITGLEDAKKKAFVCIAGAATCEDKWVTNGGRVLTVVAREPTFALARERAYRVVQSITWSGVQYRKDIAEKEAAATVVV